MLLIVCIAYGNFGVLLFGEKNENFRDYSMAFVTMLRIIITDFDYFDLEKDSPVIAPIFFMSYIMLMFLMLLVSLSQSYLIPFKFYHIDHSLEYVHRHYCLLLYNGAKNGKLQAKLSLVFYQEANISYIHGPTGTSKVSRS